jgi:hypothetical protein
MEGPLRRRHRIVGSTPEQLRAAMLADRAPLRKVIAGAGISE